MLLENLKIFDPPHLHLADEGDLQCAFRLIQ